MLLDSQITILPKDLEGLRDKWLLLDADVLIDAYQARLANSFKKLFLTLKNEDCQLAVVSAGVVEFLMGTNGDLNVMNKARTYLNELIDGVLQISGGKSELSQEIIDMQLISAYGKGGQQVSYADYMIGRTLKKYSNSTFILTGNHRDFPLAIFDLNYTIVLEDSAAKNKIYGIYSFSPAKYEQRVEELLRREDLNKKSRI